MSTAVGASDDGFQRFRQWLGIAVAAYGAYQAVRAGKLTPHAVVAVAGLLVALGPELG
ncbi:MAG: hypothetical protein ACR2MZ_05250 [Candidatus Dormibacter sp.]|uniref:hypothetical protein n=1 Tax=Candidatus Dormibacter sp. TaxID=2973982 RepID=UPI0026967844